MDCYDGFDHDDIWGSIDDYCNAIGRTVGQLIEEKKLEISYLSERRKRLLDARKDMSHAMKMAAIEKVIMAKKEKLIKFIKWSKAE